MLNRAHAVAMVDPSDALHRRLARFNRRRIVPTISDARWEQTLHEDVQIILLEGRFIEAERAALKLALRAVPKDPDDFMSWFSALREHGPGQHDPLFNWLATTASLEEMCWFLEQEVGGEAGFDDLVALTQLHMPPRPKLEMARNYWDEMGRGRAVRMHGPMLQRACVELGIRSAIDHVAWEALALANLMQGLATHRRYAYQSVGALGVVELTAPSRVSLVAEGLERLGVSAHGRSYFSLHSSVDIEHSRAWNEEVIAPLIDYAPEVQVAIAEGALLRLNAGARCFERYRRFLMPGAPSGTPPAVQRPSRSPLQLGRAA